MASNAIDVRVVEMGPRDGLQNEKQPIPTATKLELIDRLAATGLPMIEATSFVSPTWVPQLADAADVMQGIRRRDGVTYPVLVPNVKGLQRALDSGAREVAVFTAASDAFNQRNINCTTAESLERLRPVVQAARAQDLWVRCYVSTALGCPYQGKVPLGDVVSLTTALYEMGCVELVLSDTIGVGTAKAAREMVEACAKEVPVSQLAVHYHDTYGQAMANVYASLEAGVRVVDGSVAGLGGCPYATGASGNLATEDLVYLLEGMGLRTGVDLDALCEVSLWISAQLGRESGGRLARVRAAKRCR
jgi:hydroxymethylglutaryl-CoA lyase